MIAETGNFYPELVGSVNNRRAKLVATSELFALSASPDIKSDAFAFELILADKLSVSFAIRLLNILAVSDNFNLVISDESV